MQRDRHFHSKSLSGGGRNVQLTLSAFSKWCNIITWGSVLSSKWDKFIFCAAAFVPSGREAIKLEGSAGSRARHMWREWGARRKGLATAQISASAFCAGPCFWEAGGRNIVEQISSNLSVPVWDSCGKAALLRPSPPVPRISPVYPSQCQNAVRQMRSRRGGLALLGSPCFRGLAHVCSQQAGTLPWRKSLSWEGLARNRSFFQTDARDCVTSNIRTWPFFFFLEWTLKDGKRFSYPDIRQTR